MRLLITSRAISRSMVASPSRYELAPSPSLDSLHDYRQWRTAPLSYDGLDLWL